MLFVRFQDEHFKTEFDYPYIIVFRKTMLKCDMIIRLLRNVYFLISQSSLYCIALYVLGHNKKCRALNLVEFSI